MKISQKVSKLLRRHYFTYTEIYQEHSYKKTAGGDIILVLVTLSDDALYLYHVL